MSDRHDLVHPLIDRLMRHGPFSVATAARRLYGKLPTGYQLRQFRQRLKLEEAAGRGVLRSLRGVLWFYPGPMSAPDREDWAVDLEASKRLAAYRYNRGRRFFKGIL